jgi:hypothetical protein
LLFFFHFFFLSFSLFLLFFLFSLFYTHDIHDDFYRLEKEDQKSIFRYTLLFITVLFISILFLIKPFELACVLCRRSHMTCDQGKRKRIIIIKRGERMDV